MQTSAIRSLLVVIALTAIGQTEEPAIKWVRRLDEAKRTAAEQHKDLLINFTGIGWCHKCELLDREVFSQKAFRSSANDFVLVELDFPSDLDVLGDELRGRYQQWKAQYLIHGFPTVVLADAAGKPYAYMTGHDSEITATKFIELLATFQAARRTRDEHLTSATKLSGHARAQMLHAAIQAIAPLLGTIDEREEDPVLVFYDDLVEEIRALDADNSAGLRQEYDTRVVGRSAWIDRETVFKQLDQFDANKDHAAAITYIDQSLPNVKDQEMVWRLERARQVYLEWDDQYDRALANARRLMQDPNRTSADYEFLLDSEAYNLFNSGRIDEGVQSYDRRIANAVDHPAQRLKLLLWKSQLLLNRDRRSECITAHRELLSATKPGSDYWENAIGNLVGELISDGQHREALALRQELLEYYRTAGRNVAPSYIGVADCQIALGLLDEARESLNQAEKMMTANAERPKDKASVEYWKKRLTETRQLIEAGK